MKKTITIKDYYNLVNKYGDLGVNVNTPYGYKKINGCEITEPNGKILKVTLEDGFVIEGSFNHKLKAKNGEFVVLSELIVGQEIQTKDGDKKIVSIINDGLIEDLYDIEVDEVRQYYTNGIVSHNSVLSVDLPLFLFFNETTKTNKAEEIFNTFTDKNKVTVRGEIVIDGEDYIIERNIVRKLAKSGEWNVKTELDFFKKLEDGSLINFTGEQIRETESFIKNSIGTKEDFLMTILTTANNLEEFIDSKPTARGTVLSRFMGLDFLKRKEEDGKELYSKFSKSMISNIYNSENLKNENDDLKLQNKTLNSTNESLEKDLIDVQDRIIKGQTYRDELNNKKHIDIDREISQLVPEKVQNEIKTYEKQKEDTQKLLSELKVVEPSEYYHEDKHDEVKKQYNEQYKEFVRVESEISSIDKLSSSVSGGIKCEHCGIDLMNASITQSRINERAGFITHKDQIQELMRELTGKDESFVKLKKEFDEYEKNKLIKEKYDITIESLTLKIKGLNEKLDKYFELQNKILENDKIESQLIKASTRLQELDQEKNLIIRNIENNKSTISNNIKTIEGNIKKIQTIKEESEKERIYKIYLDIFGKNGISKLIMRNMIPLINSELQRLLVDSSYFRVEVRLNAKNEVDFIMVDNNTQIEKNMASGSGYEKTIASLALRSVLSKVCSLPKPNIIVFDEVFGKISNDNLEMVSEFFIKIKEYFEKIFIITHNPMVTNWADNIIKIKKEENISYLEK